MKMIRISEELYLEIYSLSKVPRTLRGLPGEMYLSAGLCEGFVFLTIVRRTPLEEFPENPLSCHLTAE